MAEEIVLKQERCLEELKRDEYIKKKLQELKVIEEKKENIEDLLK